MRHKPRVWNGIWSDMMIESTYMRYGHGVRGSSLTGLTLNSSAGKRWALSMHVTSQLKSDVCELSKQDKINNSSIYHKPE